MNNIFIFGDIFPSCDWKFISYFNINTKPPDENNNKFISAESGDFRFIPGRVLHALHSRWNVTARFYFWRTNV